MKKTYMNPNMEVVKLQMTQHLLDGSINQTLDNNKKITDTGDFGSREGDLDDDF